MRHLDALIDQVSTGDAPWRSNDALRRAALLDALQADELDGLPAGEGVPAADDSFDLRANGLADLAKLLAPGTG
jgi:hypothetical protein